MVSLIHAHLHTLINQSILKLAKKKKKNVASNYWIGRPMIKTH